MPLGTDETQACGPAFVAAMRPIAGDNVDIEEIKRNLHALGLAVHQIATVHAEPFSDKAIDDAFWTWVEELQEAMAGLASWQKSVIAAVDAWAPTTAPEQSFRGKLRSAGAAASAPAGAPAGLKGKVR